MNHVQVRVVVAYALGSDLNSHDRCGVHALHSIETLSLYEVLMIGSCPVSLSLFLIHCFSLRL